MEMEPSSLLRSMDVDLGAGLGDDLGGFEGFDDLFAHQSTTSDFFKFCALDEAEQDATVAAVPATLSPGSSGASLGPFVSVGYGFAQQESCRLAQQSQTQNWENTLPLLTTDSTTTALAHVRGKPRGRKRLEEDEALEAEEVACPSIKRRSSASVMKTEERAAAMPVPPRITHAASSGRLSDRPHSFEATPAAAAWGTGVAVQGSNPATPAVVSCRELPIGDAARATQVAPPGGAIKVKKDVTSGLTRPRISVFMSSARRGSKKISSSSSSSSPSPGSLVAGGAGSAAAAATATAAAATPTNYDYLLPPKVELTMTHPASSAQAQQQQLQQQQQQRLRDMKIAVRARTQAEKYVVETNPAVVAMGSRHTSSGMALDEAFAVPTLQRATSVGALTIAGGGELMSKSPVLSSSGRILQACELSDQVGDGGRRRNLVCKVFGSGSPFSRPSNGGLGR